MGIVCGAYAVAPYSGYIWKTYRISLFTPDGGVCGAYSIRPYSRCNPKTRSILGLSVMDDLKTRSILGLFVMDAP